MIIDCISDLHGHYPTLEGGDLLIVAGDLTARDERHQYEEFFAWLESQKYKNIVYIAGNHDGMIQKGLVQYFPFMKITYLQDSITIINDLKIWGSPWTSQFPGINPQCCAFTYPFMASLKDRWDMIPDDTDILITHSPPYGVFDTIKTEHMAHVGDMALHEAVMNRIRPKLHVFGHIHEHGGSVCSGFYADCATQFVNASIVNEHYQMVNKPVRIIL